MTETRPLRILTYNIWVGGEGRLPLILDVVRGQDPDVVAMQEANDQGNVAALARELGMALVYGEANAKYSIAWLSRLPILRSENYRRPVFRKTLLEIEVEWRGGPLRLFATHLDAGRSPEGEQHRTKEMRAILDVVRERGVAPHVLVGDFNTLAVGAARPPDERLSEDGRERTRTVYAVPRQAVQMLLDAGYTDCFAALHADRQGYTYKAWEPVARFDYIFASPEIAPRLRACDVVTSPPAREASDHIPVVAEFA